MRPSIDLVVARIAAAYAIYNSYYGIRYAEKYIQAK